MIIIVDANIVFSGILNTNGKIGDILISSDQLFNFIAPDFLRLEIFKHYKKLAKISGMTRQQLRESESQITKNITFISEEQINEGAWKEAHELVADVDPKDIHYIAFALHFNCALWSGDKSLVKGVTKKGFTSFISTEDIFQIKNKKPDF